MGRRLGSVVLGTVALLCVPNAAQAGPFELLTRIDPGQTRSSNPRPSAALGGTTLLVANDGQTGSELWKTDGTAGGTELVKDILPGSNGSGSGDGSGGPYGLVTLGSAVYFFANDGTHGIELWRSDGTIGGTELVKDINPGPDGSAAHDLVRLGDALWFSADDGEHGEELWKSDGTTAGTGMAMDINPAAGVGSNPSYLTTVNSDWLAFAADDGTNGVELWRMAGGVISLHTDINPGAGSSDARNLAAVNGDRVVLSANDGTHGQEPWVAGVGPAALIADVNPGPSGSGPDHFTDDGLVHAYFAAYDGTTVGRELWRTDSVAGGTTGLIADIHSYSSFLGGDSYPRSMVVVDHVLVFIANDFYGTAVWRSDGQPQGTFPLAHGATDWAATAYAYGGSVYFSVDDPAIGAELWKTDATVAGTQVVQDINAGKLSSSPSSFFANNGDVFFQADDPAKGTELWKTDGSADGTHLVKDINIITAAVGGHVGQLMDAGGTLFFTTEGPGGLKLWRTDGTANGTLLLQDGLPVWNAFTSAGTYLFFVGRDGEPWRTDGSAAGTFRLVDIIPGSDGASILTKRPWSNAHVSATIGNTVFFVAQPYRGNQQSLLWKTDGTHDGTVLVKASPDLSSPSNLTAAGDTLFFSSYNGSGYNGPDLWKSDGTESGTFPVTYFGLSPTEIVSRGSTVFFAGKTSTYGDELWTSDGTPDGTKLVKDIAPDASDSQPHNLTVVGNYVYFSADDGSHGYEPWRSDGTESGTTLMADVEPAAERSQPEMFTGIGDRVVFHAYTGATGHELFVTAADGGISLLKDIMPASGSSWPGVVTSSGDGMITAFNGLLYFTAIAPDVGATLWQTDGSAAGTVLTQDFDPRPPTSSPGWPPSGDNELSAPVRSGPSGSVLYIETFSSDNGWELWRMPAPATAEPTPAAGGPPPAAPAALVAGLGKSGKTTTKRVGRNGILVTTGYVMSCPPKATSCNWRVTASSVVPRSIFSKVKTKRYTIGTAKGSCKPGKTAKIRFKLNKRGVKALRKLKKMKVRLRVTLRVNGAGGTTRTVTRTVVIKVPPKKKPSTRAAGRAATV